MVMTRPPKTIVKPTALGPVANTDTKLLIYGLFQKGRVLAQDDVRASRLVHDLAVARGDGSYARVVSRLAKLDLLAIDDWLLHPLKDADRRDLMEVIEERAERGSTLIATQLPVKQWHMLFITLIRNPPR